MQMIRVMESSCMRLFKWPTVAYKRHVTCFITECQDILDVRITYVGMKHCI